MVHERKYNPICITIQPNFTSLTANYKFGYFNHLNQSTIEVEVFIIFYRITSEKIGKVQSFILVWLTVTNQRIKTICKHVH